MKASLLILPGVGAFADGISELISRNLVDGIREYSKMNKPLLGICLGMQMLFEQSEEFGSHSGLGIILGLVKKILTKNLMEQK